MNEILTTKTSRDDSIGMDVTELTTSDGTFVIRSGSGHFYDVTPPGGELLLVNETQTIEAEGQPTQTEITLENVSVLLLESINNEFTQLEFTS